MKENVKKILRKGFVFGLLSGVIATSIFPTTIYAEEENEAVEETIEDEQTEEEISEELSSEAEEIELEEEGSEDQNGDNEEAIQPADITLAIDFTSEEEVHSAFEDFLVNFESYSESELLGYIETFFLFIDDENNVHSTIEVFDASRYTEEQLASLIDLLNNVREENLEPSRQEYEPFSVEEQDPLEESFQAFSNDIMSSSSAVNSVNRMAGSTRFLTATQISRQGWNSSPTVIIANAYEFADALAGVPLATITNSPILLVPSHAVPQVTLQEINRLGSVRAIILGGENAVSSNVENTLRNQGLSVTRYAGENRYQTAEVIANEIRRRTGSNEAFLVSGEDFADAMSIASIAGQRGAPIYLSRGNTLSGQARNAARSIPNWTVIGGTDALNQNVYNVLGSSGATSRRRISGQNRYQTNLAVLNYYGISGNQAYVATGQDFVDALTGSVLAGRQNSGVMLVDDTNAVKANAIDFAESNSITRFTLFGGEIVLPSSIAEAFQYMRVNGRKPLIVLDPGHGGHDPGPIYGGVSEKELNLLTARYIRDILVASGNYDVVMTRDSDVFIELTERPRIANRRYADIFVSIHYNAMGGTGNARGIETFVHHPTYPQQVTRNNLNMNDPRIRESAYLADNMHNLLIQRTGLNNRGVKGLNLNVLRNTEMPAVLTELGFMDNAVELAIIRTQSYRSTASHAVKDGIDRYFGF